MINSSSRTIDSNSIELPYKIESNHTLKKSIKIHQKCPICNEKLNISIDPSYISNIEHFPFAHVLIHGEPLHAIMLYIDSNFSVRGFECVESLQFSRNSNTFSQIVHQWSNPF